MINQLKNKNIKKNLAILIIFLLSFYMIYEKYSKNYNFYKIEKTALRIEDNVNIARKELEINPQIINLNIEEINKHFYKKFFIKDGSMKNSKIYREAENIYIVFNNYDKKKCEKIISTKILTNASCDWYDKTNKSNFMKVKI